ncbi:3-phosphoglycerate dehydrogenase family protein [Aliagarivorans marinus]|uniref:3-phosphoglycerate dehydrogenase family protein n=1 Tax=Aliagarivorans marinus TaxID=561965 RepID=UPI0004215876|nr:3-phosphoglycerate dehydrogenase family protein [Aliagarivorans marinus]
MRNIRTYNNISPVGLARFPQDDYLLSADISNPDALMLRSQNLHQEDFPESVKAIARCGAGVNNIPVDQCTHQGIVVFNTPGANANAVKELVLTGMLMSARKVAQGLEFVAGLDGQSGADDFNKLVEREKKRFVGGELNGKTLGVVGLGAIGASVAHAALNLGMRVIGYDPVLSVDAAWRLSSQIEKAENLASLLSRCDYVSLHVPANAHTKGLINAEMLANIQVGATLLNFARGSIVEEDALLSALAEERLSAYVCDFPSPALLGQSRVLLLPHLGASTQEAEQNCARMAAEQLIDFLENGNIRNSVNFPDIYLERSGGHRIAFANDNVPNVLSQVLAKLSALDINVMDMLNKSRGDIAYTILDVADEPGEHVLNEIASIEHVFHVSRF